MQSQPQSYQQFAKLSKEQQGQLVNNKKQSAPSPFQPPAQFPQVGFLSMNSVQEQKQIKLATYRYAAQKTKAVVILFHTMAYHMNIYGNIGKTFASNGITVVGFDMRGHGKSQGQRAYIDSLDQVLEDCRAFIAAIFSSYPNIPIFLMGHGGGSKMCLILQQQLKQYKFAGLILTSTMLKKPAHNKLLQVISGAALTLLPNKTGLIQPQFDMPVSNPNATEFIKKQPNIYHGKILVGTLNQMMGILEKYDQKTWKNLQTPSIVIIQGQYDKIADPVNAINFYEALKTKDKQLWWYSNMWNNWFFEPQAEEITNRLVKWISSRV